jgi:uncharacterized membrane protein
MKTTRGWWLAVAAVLIAACPSANAQMDLTTWTFAPVDVPGATRTYVRGMNGAGQIVGHYTSEGVTRGFLLDDGVFTPIELGTFTSARGINPEGDIVGTFRVPPAATRGFLLRNGVLSEIAYPGAAYTQPDDINAAGDVVGYYLLNGVEHGFLLRSGVYTSIDVPGASLTNARGISPEGEIVGVFTAVDLDNVQRTHGFLLCKDGSFTTINGPDVLGGNTNGINPRGDLVGEYSLSGVRFGFLLQNGQYTSISYPGANVTITRPWKITPDGQHIIGFYNDLHGFVLSRKPMR